MSGDGRRVRRGWGGVNIHFSKDNLILLTESYSFLFYFYTLSHNGMYDEMLNLNEGPCRVAGTVPVAIVLELYIAVILTV